MSSALQRLGRPPTREEIKRLVSWRSGDCTMVKSPCLAICLTGLAMVHRKFLRKPWRKQSNQLWRRLVQRFLQVLLPLLQEERPKLQPLLKALSNERRTELLVKVLEVLGEDGRMGSCHGGQNWDSPKFQGAKGKHGWSMWLC